jgi:serine/threonine-protein kinase
MSVTSGTRLGPYEIVGKLGAGGMGEVYRASDTRLKRQVAIKVLPPALAEDPDRLARFQREAEVLAALNHPHIAAIYGLEDSASAGSGQAGMKALVMELVEGPTLADRIAQGRIPIAEALPIAKQLAGALEAAHERGIVHRDLKPANIKIRDDGTVKVLDFGLAKLTEAERADRSGIDPALSPTLTSPAAVTGMGMILGTAAYMSPEQARGRAVDKRTDIWAFGAVLYEMLTGARAFDGEDTTEMMASVVKSTPNWNAIPPDVPPHLVTLVQRCLEKDRNARIGDIAVARFLLDGHAAIGPSASEPLAPTLAAPRRSVSALWAGGAAAVALIAGAAGVWLLHGRPAATPGVAHLQVGVQPAEQLVGSIASVRPSRTAIAVSPDGRTLAFVGLRDGGNQLFVRPLDRVEAVPVPGTEGASEPFFSPDGASIGFHVANRLKKVAAAGGAPVTIAEADAGSASWADDGTIFFVSADGISRVSSNGGAVATVTRRDATKRERHILPHALPGGKAVLFTSITGGWDSAAIVVHAVERGQRQVLIEGGADARYVETGHIVYMKSGTLMAVPFDTGSLRVMGAPVVLFENVMQAVNAPNTADETGAGQFAISRSGTLIYVPGGVGRVLESTLVWADRTGAAQPVAAVQTGPYLFPRLAPDGQKIALTVRRGGADVWVYELTRGAATRMTFEGGSHPIWSPDGKRLAISVMSDGVSNLHVMNADGVGKPERLLPSPFAQIPTSWASKPNVVAFLQRPDLESYAIWVLPMEPGAERNPRIFLQSRFRPTHAEFSPDGQLMAYVSPESGAPDVYVQPYPGPGEKVRVSTDGGTEPVWTANGRELVFRNGGQFLSAAVRSVTPFRVDPPRVVFTTKGEYDSTGPLRSWNLTADGQRFLLSRFAGSSDKPVTALNVVLNWAGELKRLAPPK